MSSVESVSLAASEIYLTRRRARPITRGRVLQWLRTTHVWLGLWGAVLGFVFGLTGFLMNHRALMKIPIERAEVTRAQVEIPQSFADAGQLESWLKQRAALPDARSNIKTEPAATVLWRGQKAQQPERWTVSINTSTVSVNAKYIPGSAVVDVETQDATAWGALMRLHMGSGASAFWVLLSDTIAGALMILTLSGVLLWSKLRLPRLLGATVLMAVPIATVIYLAMA
jgi:hypothetical protein